MKRFWRDDSGYVLVLSLIALPMFMAMGLIIVDIGRGNNAHSDLQAAADAMALAGARELDGSADSIDRAQAAMGLLSNSVSFLGLTESNFNIVMTTASGEFTITFLTDIPESDNTAITATYLEDNATTAGEDAEFVHVRARSQDLNTFFFNPVSRLRQNVPVAAEAVATYRTAACDVTPLFICNPFESENIDLQDAFAGGRLHGRMIRLHPKGSDTAAPGNFGFLSVTGQNDNTTSSAAAIRDIFAGDENPTCYDAKTVTTKPGAATSIRQGINVRFDIYSGPYNNAAADYPPAANVRKGYIPTNGANGVCNAESVQDAMRRAYKGKPADYVEPAPADWWAMGFSQNDTMLPPGSGALGATIGSGNWDIATYWEVNHPSVTLTSEMLIEMNSRPGAQSPGASVPSRYDVYRYEIENDLVATASQGDGTPPKAGTTENGLGQCSIASEGVPVESPTRTSPDRRTVFAAIINCIENADEGGGSNTYPVEAYGSLFLTRPMSPDNSDPAANVNDKRDLTIDVEVADITGVGGNGTLDTFVRDESVLVR